MGTPLEPLLPVEADPPSKLKLWIAIGAVAGLTIGGAAFFFLRRGEPAPAETAAAGTTETAAPRAARTDPGRRPADAPRPGDAEERQARELYEAAEAFERAEPGEYEKRMARWRDVVTKHPTTSWAKKADDRHRAAATSLQAILDREFEGTRRDAQALAAAGHFVDAIETLQAYRAAQTRELLKRRAEVEISGLENASRLAYNDAASKARELSVKGDYAGAVPLFESVAKGAIPEVAERCGKSIAQLQGAAAEHDRFEEAKKGDDARRAFREEVAPRILGFVRARRYDDALKEMSTAAAAPANAAIKDEIAAERASVVDASAFWEAFLKAVKARVGQEASLLLSDGKRVTGKISRLLEDKIVVENGEASSDAPLDRLHADLLVGWTLGKTLAAEEGLSYVKAALFFFCEGRDDLARLYLATARELNGPADAAEKIFRGGFLRAALAAKK
jgi:hypothetical protein